MRTTLVRRAAGLGAGVLAAGLLTVGAPAQAAGPFSSAAFGDIAANQWSSSVVNVAGLSGVVSDVNVTLENFSAELPNLDIYLQSPSGQRVWLVSDVCQGEGVAGAQWVIDDAAPAQLPAVNDPALCQSGSVRPANYDQGDGDFGVTAASTLAAFNGTTPNGTWTLYARNDAGVSPERVQARMDRFDLNIETAAAPVATAPETKVVKVKTKYRKIILKLSSPTPGVTFENKLKSKAGNIDWQPTKKPTKVVGKNLTNGKKILWVRAVDSLGNVDATPVKVKIKVRPNGSVKAKVKG